MAEQDRRLVHGRRNAGLRPRGRPQPIPGQDWLLVPVLLGGLALRTWGINFGLPAIYRPDENVIVGRAMGVLQQGVLDPHFANYPHLYYYLSAGWLFLLRPLFPLFGGGAPYLGVRLLDAIFGTGTIFMTYLVGRRAYGWSAGLLGALGVSVSFLLVRDSHFATLDSPLTFTVTLTLYLALRYAESGSLRLGLIAGAAAGIATSIKYNGVLVISALSAARELYEPWTSWRSLRRGVLVLAGVGIAALIAFALTSPFLLIDFAFFGSSIVFIFHHLANATVPEIGWVHIVRLALWYGLDPPLFLLGLIGIGYASYRRARADWILLTFLLAYYGLMGMGYGVYTRYADPLVPPLLLLGGRVLVEIANRLGGRISMGTQILPALVLVAGILITAVPPVAHDVAYDHLITGTDTRTLAYDWIQANIPAGAKIAALYYSGPIHGESLIDSGAESYGAPTRYIASFLQNRIDSQHAYRELKEADVTFDSLDQLRAEGVQYVVSTTPAPGDRCVAPTALQTALASTGPPLVTVSPTRACTDAVFDPIDSYYVPLSNYSGWDRPGPLIRIYKIG